MNPSMLIKKQNILILALFLIGGMAHRIDAAWEIKTESSQCDVPECITNTTCSGEYPILISGGSQSLGSGSNNIKQIFNYRYSPNTWETTASEKMSKGTVICAKEVPQK
jgi:hypothetical protein